MSAPRPQGTSRWSWSIGRLGGVDIRIHATFVILLGWIVLAHLVAGQGASGVAGGLLFIVAVFAVVVVHELGHALVARRFGIPTRDIILLPIGGVSRLERMPHEPRQELLVALAGPAVNVALAAVAFLAILLVDAPWSPESLSLVGGPILDKLLWLNIGLAGFNLLPAFPMDGGRVLRAVLAMKLDRVRATDVAARIGHWMALAFGFIGLFGSPILVFIALFVWVGATEEAAHVHRSAALAAMLVRDAMVTRFETLSADTSIGDAAERAIHSVQREFPVVDGDRLIGLVGAVDLARRAAEGDVTESVAAIARPIGDTAEPGEPVEQALERLEATSSEALPVIQAGRLVGLLVPQNVARLMGVRDAMRYGVG